MSRDINFDDNSGGFKFQYAVQTRREYAVGRPAVVEMDAPHDRDVELQKESGDLIRELKTKLPSLLWKPRVDRNGRQLHRWTKSAKVDKLIALVRYFCASLGRKDSGHKKLTVVC